MRIRNRRRFHRYEEHVSAEVSIEMLTGISIIEIAIIEISMGMFFAHVPVQCNRWCEVRVAFVLLQGAEVFFVLGQPGF